MPPKVSAKNAQKAKQQTIDDKTFGLKNKNRSAKVNRYVQQVTSQVYFKLERNFMIHIGWSNRRQKRASNYHFKIIF